MATCKRRSDDCKASECSTNQTFDCLDIPNSVVLCDFYGRVKSLLACNCANYYGVSGDILIGRCIYTCQSKVLQYLDLPAHEVEWNVKLCDQFQRKGPLCGQCKDSFYLPVYSYDMTCVHCTDNSDWWKFVLIAFFPLTIFYVFLVVFKINIHSSFLLGYVFYCQAVTTLPLGRILYISTRSNTAMKLFTYIIGSFYSVWNLDFFRFFSPNICLQTDTLATACLDIVVAAYPLFLLLLTYGLIIAYDKNVPIIVLLWKPFSKCLKYIEHSSSLKGSLIDSFSTFFYLFAIKSISVCTDVLTPVQTHRLSSNGVTSEYRLYIDASLPFLVRSHISYAIVGLVIVSVVGVLPSILLLFYPFKFFQHLLLYMPQSWRLSVSIFVDTMQCCYKDGTEEGTRDYRWLSGFFFGSRLVFAVLYGLTLNSSFLVLNAIILTVFIMALIIINPYKDQYGELNTSVTLYLILLASFSVMCDAYGRYVQVNIVVCTIIVALAIMPLIYTCYLSVHHLYHHFIVKSCINQHVA